MILPVLPALPWKLIAAAAGVICILILGWRINAWHRAYQRLDAVETALEAERECAPETRCAERLKALKVAGIVAVETARQAAQEAAGREQARRAAQAQAEAERLTAAATDAKAKAKAWRAKFEAARQQPECAKWSAMPISCPSS